MRRNILAVIVLLALAGLTFIQFRLLVIGAKLEKLRFDQQLLVAQRNIRIALDEPNTVSDALIRYLKSTDQQPHEKEILADSLHFFLQQELAKEDIGAQFSYAITPRFITQEVPFTSNNFKPEKFNFREYVIPLGNYFSSQLFRQYTLHIDVENLFGYLLIELDYLVIPSILCLLALLVCLWLLVNILQKEQKLNEVKNNFIDNLTHELKTPAFSISLSNKMAREHLEKGNYEKVEELLQIIEKENNKLKSHTEKVLELASLESPGHQLQKEQADLHAVIQEVVEDFSKKTKMLKGEIKMDLWADQFHLKADKVHFRNVIHNLLDNAFKYSGDQPVINLETENENRALVIKIRDNGPGIPVAEQKLIFDKFYRVSNGDIHRVKGFGLGLNYVKQVVESHHGKIEVSSKPGEGATFIIRLPV